MFTKIPTCGFDGSATQNAAVFPLVTGLASMLGLAMSRQLLAMAVPGVELAMAVTTTPRRSTSEGVTKFRAAAMGPMAPVPPPDEAEPPPVPKNPPPVEEDPPPDEADPPPAEPEPPPVDVDPPPLEAEPPPVEAEPPPVDVVPPPEFICKMQNPAEQLCPKAHA